MSRLRESLKPGTVFRYTDGNHNRNGMIMRVKGGIIPNQYLIYKLSNPGLHDWKREVHVIWEPEDKSEVNEFGEISP